MDEDRDDSQSLTSSVVREETNATDRHDHGTFSQADDIEKQLQCPEKVTAPRL